MPWDLDLLSYFSFDEYHGTGAILPQEMAASEGVKRMTRVEGRDTLVETFDTLGRPTSSTFSIQSFKMWEITWKYEPDRVEVQKWSAFGGGETSGMEMSLNDGRIVRLHEFGMEKDRTSLPEYDEAGHLVRFRQGEMPEIQPQVVRRYFYGSGKLDSIEHVGPEQRFVVHINRDHLGHAAQIRVDYSNGNYDMHACKFDEKGNLMVYSYWEVNNVVQDSHGMMLPPQTSNFTFSFDSKHRLMRTTVIEGNHTEVYLYSYNRDSRLPERIYELGKEEGRSMNFRYEFYGE